MVIVKIGDGLGNQMYNYVCGYAVAKHDRDTLKLDTSDVDNSTLRSYGLDQFNISCDRRESFSNKTVFHKIFKRLRRNILYRVIFEKKGEANPYDMNVYSKKVFRNKYLHGYFQNYCYYESCKEEIDKQFTPRKPFGAETVKLIEALGTDKTCSFHIRGGDIPPLSIDYYKQAIAAMEKECPDIRYIVFTNDRRTATEYIKELGMKKVSFIWELGNFTDFEELFLMKACGSHIISDSTFSRWAGFLDEKKGFTVAPAGLNDNKIYPEEWKIIKLK